MNTLKVLISWKVNRPKLYTTILLQSGRSFLIPLPYPALQGIALQGGTAEPKTYYLEGNTY
jgi:hypothetical protein